MSAALIADAQKILNDANLTPVDVEYVYKLVRGSKKGATVVMAFVVLVFILSLAIMGIVAANWAKTIKIPT